MTVCARSTSSGSNCFFLFLAWSWRTDRSRMIRTAIEIRPDMTRRHMIASGDRGCAVPIIRLGGVCVAPASLRLRSGQALPAVVEASRLHFRLYFTWLDAFDSPRMALPSSSEGKGAYPRGQLRAIDRKSTRLNSSHVEISYAVFCLKKKKNKKNNTQSIKQ